MNHKLLLWIRDNGLNQRQVARAAGRSEAWLSKRLRAHVQLTAEERELILSACRHLTHERAHSMHDGRTPHVAMSDLFEAEAA